MSTNDPRAQIPGSFTDFKHTPFVKCAASIPCFICNPDTARELTLQILSGPADPVMIGADSDVLRAVMMNQRPEWRAYEASVVGTFHDLQIAPGAVVVGSFQPYDEYARYSKPVGRVERRGDELKAMVGQIGNRWSDPQDATPKPHLRLRTGGPDGPWCVEHGPRRTLWWATVYDALQHARYGHFDRLA